ncbi:MAG: MFS transporter [Armatimonadetes bacterium]|nr:MFS transporter [Armatimonadota bacterium]
MLATGWVSLFTDLSSEIIYPLLPLFLVGPLGASVGFVGVIEGFAESVASLLKLVSGWWSDQLGKRRPLVVGGYCLSGLTRPLMALAAAPWQVLVIRICDRVGKGLRSAPRDALIADVTEPELRGKAFGYQRAMDHTGAVLGPLVAFGLLHGCGWKLSTVFAVAAIPSLLATVAVVGWVRDRPDPPRPAVARPPVSFAAWRGLDRRLVVVVAVIGLFTLGNSSDAFLLLRARDLGVGEAWIPIVWVALHLVKAVSSTPGGSLSDRVGRRRVIIGGWAVYGLVYLGFGLASAAWQAWALFAVYGLYFGLTEGAEKALVADLAGKELKGTAFSLYTFVVGIAALPASLIMGYLWQAAGPLAAFGLGAGLAVAASVAMALCAREPVRP